MPSISHKSILFENFIEIGNYDIPELFVEDINKKYKKSLPDFNYCTFNICPQCYSHLNIRIDNELNIIITYCEKCKKSWSKGININKFIQKNKKENNILYCKKCLSVFDYDKKTKKLSCKCEQKLSIKHHLSPDLIPIFLKDCYCDIHNSFHKYYLKYSKKGLCDCCMKELKNNYLIEQFSQEETNNLINQKLKEFQKEKKLLLLLQKKFYECIKLLRSKFEKYMDIKKKILFIKSDLINNLKILKNNNTIISNIKSITFENEENFNYKEDDSIETKLKKIFNFFNCKLDRDKFSFGENHIKIDGPYNNILQKEEDIKVTDIYGLKNNKLICVSFLNGQAKIFDTNTI